MKQINLGIAAARLGYFIVNKKVDSTEPNSRGRRKRKKQTNKQIQPLYQNFVVELLMKILTFIVLSLFNSPCSGSFTNFIDSI